MGLLQPFTIIELSTCVGAVVASIAMLCAAIQKSKCKNIKCCCIQCERDQKAIELDLERQNTQPASA